MSRIKGVPKIVENPPHGEPSDNGLYVTNNDGRGYYSRQVKEFEGLPQKEQHEALRAVWKSIAMGIATRARQFSTTCSPKDFTNLYRLVSSGATALDKAFPPKQEPQSPKLIVNLFQSLGLKATRIAIPETPVIECQPETPTEPSPESGSPGTNT